MKIAPGAALAAALLASPAFAQSSSGSFSDVPDRFQIDAGYFRINPNTVLRFDPAAGSGNDIDFEKDLGLEQSANTAWIEGSWRLGYRHQLKLGYTRQSRSSDDVVLERDFTWGGQVYEAGLTAGSENGTDLLGGYYRFAIVRNDRFEIGPTVGIGYIWLDARVRATGTVTGPGGSTSRNLDESASTSSITGAVGGYASGWLLRRLSVEGNFLYFKLSSDGDDASIADWRLAAYYYFLRNAGLGVQYKYNRFTYDRGLRSQQLGGQVTYQGVQVLLSFRF